MRNSFISGELKEISLSRLRISFAVRGRSGRSLMRDYEPQSDAATRMLASATGMAAALSFGCVFVGTIVSALLSRLS